MLIGVVSDTHGYFQPRLGELFKDVDQIVHAGDIGAPSVIDALEEIAPVVAVRGNVDYGLLAASYPSWLELDVEGRKVLLLHRGGGILQADPTLAAILQHVRPGVLVYGHTHRALAAWEDGVYCFNPGLGGRPRLGIQPTAGLLTIERDRVEGKILRL